MLLLGSAVNAWSPPWGSGASCTGTGDPPEVPACYEGKASIPISPVAEQVKLSVLEYSGGKGILTIHATGLSPEDCGNTTFTKTGQEIQFDASCLSGAKVDAKYCSDTDTINVEVQPSKFPLKVPATLTKVAC